MSRRSRRCWINKLVLWLVKHLMQRGESPGRVLGLDDQLSLCGLTDRLKLDD